jgi:hypothetical protein
MRIITAASAFVGVLVLGVGTAQAATTYSRLSGTYKPTSTITFHKAFPMDKGKVVNGRTWKFTPSCTGTNGCATQLKRERNSDSTVVTYKSLTPSLASAKTVYKGSTSYLSACYNNDGSLRVANAYATTETVNLTVTGTGNAATFKGTLIVKFVPNAVGNKNNCLSDQENVSVVSHARTGA